MDLTIDAVDFLKKISTNSGASIDDVLNVILAIELSKEKLCSCDKEEQESIDEGARFNCPVCKTQDLKVQGNPYFFRHRKICTPCRELLDNFLNYFEIDEDSL